MARGSKSTEKEAADARRIQQFLEQAAALILESRTMDSARFAAVVAMAEGLGLSHAQLRRELQFLQERGVIADVPLDQLGPADGDQQESAGSAPLATEAVQKPPPASDAPAPHLDPTRVSPPRPASASVARAAPEPVRPPDRSERGRPKGEEAGPEPGTGLAAETPTKPTARRTPMDAFRNWVDQQLDDYSSALLAIEDEDGLVGVGMHRHHLAQILARHIVRDVATDHKIRLERDLEAASEHSTVDATAPPSSDQDQLKTFFDQVAPILALHRGITAQSRVLMNAVAQRLGMTQEELEGAIVQLQRSPAVLGERDPRQVERRESYRRYLRRSLAQLPKGVITFKTRRKLEEAGEYFHGVAPEWIEPTINEVASEMGARFVSKQQAVDHVAALVEDMLVREVAIAGQTRVRLYGEGTRWGLEPMDIEAILREQTQRRKMQLATERRRTRNVLMLAAATVFSILAFLAWLVRPEPSGAETPVERPKVVKQDGKTSTAATDRASWWSADLRIAVANLRAVMPKDKKDLLQRMDTDAAAERATVYERLVKEFPSDTAASHLQSPAQELLVALYAEEPSDSAASQLATALLQPVIDLDKQLPADKKSLKGMFWACRTAVRMWKAPELRGGRAAELRELLESAVGKPLDRFLEIKPLDRQCLGALVERFYVQLTRAAPADPEQVEQLYRALSIKAIEYLNQSARDQFDAEFLAAALPALRDEWTRYEDVIEQVINSREPPTVLRTLRIYENATDPVLRDYMEDRFLRRLGAESETLTPAEMVAEVRKSLGLSASPGDSSPWDQLIQRVGMALKSAPIEGTRLEVLLEDSLELAYFATLACALAQGELESATYQALAAKGPPEVDTGAGPFATKARSPLRPAPNVPPSMYVEQYITNLGNARTGEMRVRLMRMIANSVDRIPDVSPEAGQTLAKYLTSVKSDEREHRAVLSVIGQLAQWNSVRLGLADQLNRGLEHDKQLEELYAEVVGENRNLETEAARQATKRRLLARVVEDLAGGFTSDEPHDSIYQQGAEQLVSLYKQQARMLGVAADEYASVKRPSAMLLRMIDHLTTKLSGKSLKSESRALLDGLQYELRAIQFVAEDELQYTVLLDHLWLRVLAIDLVSKRPDRLPASRELISRLEQLDSKSKNILEQLRHTHAILLELWMLYRPANEGARRET